MMELNRKHKIIIGSMITFSILVVSVSYIAKRFSTNPTNKSQFRATLHEENASEVTRTYTWTPSSEKTGKQSEKSIEEYIETGSNTSADLAANPSSAGDSDDSDTTDEVVNEGLTEELPDELKLKVERYTKLAKILPTFREVQDERFRIAKQGQKKESVDINVHAESKKGR